jgi:hypothetical protein
MTRAGDTGSQPQENAAGRGLKSRSRSKAAREIWRWKTQLAAKNFQPALLDGHRRRPEAARPKETSANENGEENQISCSSRNESGKSGRAPNPRTGSQAATQSRETRAGTVRQPKLQPENEQGWRKTRKLDQRESQGLTRS